MILVGRPLARQDLGLKGECIMTKEPDTMFAGEVKLPRRKSLDLEKADLTALANAAKILLGKLERFLDLPGPLNWSPVAFAALALEKEAMILTPDLAQPEHADAPLPLYGSCSWEKAIPFRELWVLLKTARPNPTGCGERAGGVWVPGPDNIETARAIAQRLRPIVQGLLPPAPITSELGAEPSRNTFRLEGDYWTLTFAAKTIRIKNSLGLKYIAHLISIKGSEIDAARLSSPLN